MKHILYSVLILFFNNSLSFASTDTGKELSSALKSTSHEPSFSTLIFALCFVIFLIYITGIIYSKLNVLGANTIKKQIKDYDWNRAIVVSTTQLGQNKNLHVVKLNNKHYFIGATNDSITLLKELDEKEDITKEPIQNVPEEETSNEKDDFDIHKKYL